MFYTHCYAGRYLGFMYHTVELEQRLYFLTRALISFRRTPIDFDKVSLPPVLVPLLLSLHPRLLRTLLETKKPIVSLLAAR